MDIRNDGSEMDRLMELMKLYEAGLISKEEMEDYKRKIVGNSPQLDENDDVQNDSPEPSEGFSQEESEADANISIENTNPKTQGTTNVGKSGSKAKLVIIGIVIALIVAGIGVVSNLPTKEDKVYKAMDDYEAMGYKILAHSGSYSNAGAPYIVYQDGDEIYIDEFEKKQQPRKLFPVKDGFNYKGIYLEFEHGKPVMQTETLSDERMDVDLKYLKTNRVVSCVKNKLILVFKEEDEYGMVTNFLYSLSKPNDIFLFEGEVDDFQDDDALICQNSYSFESVYGRSYDYGSYSLYDYPVDISFKLSKEDLHYIGLGKYFYGPREFYPLEQISKRTAGNGMTYTDEEINIPTSWLGTSLMDSVFLCLVDDMSLKNKKDFLDNTVAFGEMVELFRSNPVKANQLYHEGETMYLSAYVDKISYTSSGNYKYLLETENIADFNIYITTNDESFVKLNYPARVWIKAIYKGHYNLNDSFVGAVVEFFFMDDVGDRYSFEDAELYYYKEEY